MSAAKKRQEEASASERLLDAAGRSIIEGEDLAYMLAEARRVARLSQAQVAARLREMGEAAGPASVGHAEMGNGPKHVAKARREAVARGYRLSFVLTPLEGAQGKEARAAPSLEELIHRHEFATRALIAHARRAGVEVADEAEAAESSA